MEILPSVSRCAPSSRDSCEIAGDCRFFLSACGNTKSGGVCPRGGAPLRNTSRFNATCSQRRVKRTSRRNNLSIRRSKRTNPSEITLRRVSQSSPRSPRPRAIMHHREQGSSENIRGGNQRLEARNVISMGAIHDTAKHETSVSFRSEFLRVFARRSKFKLDGNVTRQFSGNSRTIFGNSRDFPHVREKTSESHTRYMMLQVVAINWSDDFILNLHHIVHRDVTRRLPYY